MHETMVRLYQAAKELKGIDGRGAQSEIARLFGASPQQIKNWERRGMLPSCKQAPGTKTTCIRRNL